MRKLTWLWLAILLTVLGGCASIDSTTKQRQVASVLSYLFPGTEKAPVASDLVAEIKVPFRIGVAFVPDSASAEFRLSENA